MESWWSPPPPPPSSAVPSSSSGSLTSLQNVSPSIIIIILILSVTIIVSVTICLFLRFLRRLRRLSRSDSRRVSPETNGASGSVNAASSAVIDSLPLFTFSSVTRRQSSSASGDCSVCLSKFEADDRLRLLPLCCHAFHAECIDIWLQSNQTCPLCRSPIHASESDVMKVLLESSAANPGGDSFRLEIGSVSRRHQPEPDPPHQRRSSFSIGSFEYVVEHESEIVRSQTHHRHNLSDKDGAGADPTPDPALLADVGAGGRSWLKEYMDRLSASISSRSLSFRSSGRFFTGSSRRTEFQPASEYDLESNRIGEEISEMFRWFSGV